MTDLSDQVQDGVGAGGELAEPRLARHRRLRRLVPLAVAVLALAGLVGVWVPLHRSAPARPVHPVGPRAGLPGPSTAAFSMVDSPVADPAPLPDGPLPRAALIYARCGGMGAVGGEFPEDCRYRLVLTDGSQYTLPLSAGDRSDGPPAFSPGSISPDGAFLLVRDTLQSLVLRHLPSGTSHRVTIPRLADWAGWGPVAWSPGARHVAVVVDDPDAAVAVIDTATASVRRTVDLAAVAAAGHYVLDTAARDDPFVVAADGGALSWAHRGETSMTLVHWDAGAQRPRVAALDLRPHLRPFEFLMESGALLGDGVTLAVPVGKAHNETEKDKVFDAHVLLLVDVTTGAVRHRQELPTAIPASGLHSSGCGLGPDALAVAIHDKSQPRVNQPSEVISLNPWTGARDSGYQLSPRGLFALLAC